MASDESVTTWIGALKAEKEGAAQALYERYIRRLMGLARKKLGGVPRRVSDEEDIAQVVMNSFFEGVRESRFPRLRDRDDLWQVLVMLTERKVVDQVRRQFSRKRRGEVGESALLFHQDVGSCMGGLNDVMAREPSPEFAAEVAEEMERRLGQLQNEELRRIAVLKLEGRTNSEIAKELGCVTRTVERRLELIRNLWHD